MRNRLALAIAVATSAVLLIDPTASIGAAAPQDVIQSLPRLSEPGGTVVGRAAPWER